AILEQKIPQIQGHATLSPPHTAPYVITLTRKTPPPASHYCQRPRRTVHAQTRQPVWVPCGRARCSHECRNRWARKMAACLRTSFRDRPPTHEIRITVQAAILDRELSHALGRFLGRLRYRLRNGGASFAYFQMNEWSEGHRHTHILLRADAG